jgi:4-hydroxybenzoate polyprenyltransferase
MLRISLQSLIIIWWLGAVTAAISLFTPLFSAYVILGSIGWAIVLSTTALIIYEIKRIKEEDKKKQLAK